MRWGHEECWPSPAMPSSQPLKETKEEETLLPIPHALYLVAGRKAPILLARALSLSPRSPAGAFARGHHAHPSCPASPHDPHSPFWEALRTELESLSSWGPPKGRLSPPFAQSHCTFRACSAQAPLTRCVHLIRPVVAPSASMSQALRWQP